jgi:hypothetical protein
MSILMQKYAELCRKMLIQEQAMQKVAGWGEVWETIKSIPGQLRGAPKAQAYNGSPTGNPYNYAWKPKYYPNQWAAYIENTAPRHEENYNPRPDLSKRPKSTSIQTLGPRRGSGATQPLSPLSDKSSGDHKAIRERLQRQGTVLGNNAFRRYLSGSTATTSPSLLKERQGIQGGDTYSHVGNRTSPTAPAAIRPPSVGTSAAALTGENPSTAVQTVGALPPSLPSAPSGFKRTSTLSPTERKLVLDQALPYKPSNIAPETPAQIAKSYADMDARVKRLTEQSIASGRASLAKLKRQTSPASSKDIAAHFNNRRNMVQPQSILRGVSGVDYNGMPV